MITFDDALKSMVLLLKNSYFASVGKLFSGANLLAFFSDVHILVAIPGLEPVFLPLIPSFYMLAGPWATRAKFDVIALNICFLSAYAKLRTALSVGRWPSGHAAHKRPVVGTSNREFWLPITGNS
jgi:hypothetical protein